MVDEDEDGDLVLPKRRRIQRRWLLTAASERLFEAIKQNNKDNVLCELLSCPVNQIQELLNARDSHRK